MTVTKTLIKAIPSNVNGKVEEWELTVKYEKGEGETYYTTSPCLPIMAIEDGVVNFIPKAENLWTLTDIMAVWPNDHLDEIFDSQYASVITNPPPNQTSNKSFVIPS
tara:strand:+ start:1185 stop:1505 length:321 start_codon:yes stop_codon:yes gene_type:complete